MYLVWYKKYRNSVKDFVSSDDFASAKTKIDALVTEYTARFSTNEEEFSILRHAADHLVDATIFSNPVNANQKPNLLGILDS